MGNRDDAIMNKNVRYNLNPSRSRIKFYIEWPRHLDHTNDSKISRISRRRLPRSAVPIAAIDLVVIKVHITPVLVVVSENNKDSLLNIRR